MNPSMRTLILAFLVYQLIFWMGILMPFDFHIPHSLTESTKDSDGPSLHWVAGLCHALFFVPLGFLFERQRNRRTLLLIIAIALASEAAQFFVSRTPSLDDLAMDLVGCLLGFALSCAYRRSPALHSFTLHLLSPQLVLPTVAAGLLAYAWVAWPPSGSFANWDQSHALVVGNERSGDRPWDGSVEEVLLLDRALTEAEILRVFEKSDLSALNSPLLHYRFEAQAAARTPDLVGRLAGLDLVSSDSAPFAMSAESTQELHSTLGRAAAFTLCVRFRANGTDVQGPGRIVSYSQDVVSRNFTLGQENSNLHFRVRTPFAGPNGTEPELIAPKCVQPGQEQLAIAISDGRTSQVYVDGALVARMPLSALSRWEQDFFGKVLRPDLRTSVLIVTWLSLMLVFGAMLIPSFGTSLFLELGAFFLASLTALAVWMYGLWIL